MSCVNHPAETSGLAACAGCSKSYCPNCLVELKGARYCAGCKAEQVKDIQSGVQGGDLVLATISRRFAAMFIDGIVLWIPALPILFIVGTDAFTGAQTGEDPSGSQLVFQVIFLGLFVLYEGAMLQWRGQTLGKMALKLKVVLPDGKPLPPARCWIRPVVRTLLSVLYILDYLPALFRKDKASIHDMAARSRVIQLPR